MATMTAMLEDEHIKILFTISLLPFIYFQSFMNVWLILFDLLHDSVLLRNSRWPPWRPCWKMNIKRYCSQSPCCPLSISKVSWTFDLNFLIICINRFYCAIQDGRQVRRKIGNKRYCSQCPCCTLFISKVSWMYEQYFTSYCIINISDGRKDGRTDGRTEPSCGCGWVSLLKVDSDLYFVRIYLYPKFHECTTNTSRVIAVLTFRTDGRTEGRKDGRTDGGKTYSPLRFHR